jgi:hypothetical protein
MEPIFFHMTLKDHKMIKEMLGATTLSNQVLWTLIQLDSTANMQCQEKEYLKIDHSLLKSKEHLIRIQISLDIKTNKIQLFSKLPEEKDLLQEQDIIPLFNQMSSQIKVDQMKQIVQYPNLDKKRNG